MHKHICAALESEVMALLANQLCKAWASLCRMNLITETCHLRSALDSAIPLWHYSLFILCDPN